MKTAVITGASSGIGEALARRLAADTGGWRLLLVARREDRLAALGSELGDNVLYEPADLTDPAAPARVAARAEQEFDRLDLLVNNAGGNRQRGNFSEVGYAYVREIMDQNFDSAVRMTEALLPFLRRSAPSSIVNVGSIAGRIARPQVGAYNAAKFALNGWTEGLYHEERPHGVHVGLVTPGFISTEGFPQAQFTGRALTRWMVGRPEQAVDAILKAAGGKAEVAVPAWYGLLPRLRYATPGLVRFALSGRKRRR